MKGICSHEGIMQPTNQCGFTCAYSACAQSSIFEIITIHGLLLFVAHFCIIVMCILLWSVAITLYSVVPLPCFAVSN